MGNGLPSPIRVYYRERVSVGSSSQSTDGIDIPGKRRGEARVYYFGGITPSNDERGSASYSRGLGLSFGYAASGVSGRSPL